MSESHIPSAESRIPGAESRIPGAESRIPGESQIPNPESRGFVDTFIQRPILASVSSRVIILAGAISIPTLPIAQYPDLAPPQVQVTAFYSGASAQTVETAVTQPLEQAINGVEGMLYMT